MDLSRSCKPWSERGPNKKPMEAHFGGISLKWKSTSQNRKRSVTSGTDAVSLWKGSWLNVVNYAVAHGRLKVHHVRKLADLNREGGEGKTRWAIMMRARQRKTLVVCQSCHKTIHAARYDSPQMTSSTSGEPCDRETVTHGSEGSVRKVSDCIAIDAGQLANGYLTFQVFFRSEASDPRDIAIMRVLRQT